ncbi:MAG: hypothetical protein ACYS0H_23115 [Planctomycetota bacterium]
MKALALVSLFLLSGCAVSTDDLIEKAHLTGDWTAVNQRMAAIERRQARNAPSCPGGSTQMCSNRLGDKRCACIRNADVRRLLGDAGY